MVSVTVSAQNLKLLAPIYHKLHSDTTIADIINDLPFHQYSAENTGDSLKFAWPLEWTLDQGVYIGNYVDEDMAEGSIKDYMGFEHAYDGHRGTDIGPASFEEMDKGIDVLAAAPGIVTLTRYSNEDRNNEGSAGNGVCLYHNDGTVTIYWHLRKNSISVNLNESVETGDVLGLLGSSGFPLYPHLHFEIKLPDEVMRDPWAGPFNSLPCMWINQEPYVGNEFYILDQRSFPKNSVADIDNISLEELVEGIEQPVTMGISEDKIGFALKVMSPADDSMHITLKQSNQTKWLDTTIRFKQKTIGYITFNFYFADNVSENDTGIWQFQTFHHKQLIRQTQFRVSDSTRYAPGFKVTGKSIRINGSVQTDIPVLRMGGPVRYSLVSNLSAVSLERDSIVTIAAASDQVNRSGLFFVVAENKYHYRDTLWYHLVDESKPIKGNTSGWQENAIMDEILIYSPNPGSVTIQSEMSKLYMIKIYSITGQLLYSERTTPGPQFRNLDMRHFSKGIYLIILQSGDSVRSFKIRR